MYIERAPRSCAVHFYWSISWAFFLRRISNLVFSNAILAARDSSAVGGIGSGSGSGVSNDTLGEYVTETPPSARLLRRSPTS